MIPLQEFHFYLNTTENQRFVIMNEIKKADNGQFSAWIGFPQGLPTDIIINISLTALPDMYDTALNAFEALLVGIVKYAEKHNYIFTKINNPCNCELLSVEEQKNLLIQSNIEAELTVNDPPSLQAP